MGDPLERLAALEDAMARMTAENIELKTQLDAASVAVAAAASTAGSSSRPEGQVDTRVLGKPDMFKGDAPQLFRDWEIVTHA